MKDTFLKIDGRSRRGCTLVFHWLLIAAMMWIGSPAGSAQAAANQAAVKKPAAGLNLSPLFSHIWRVSTEGAQPAPGSIYIFLPNGTLLETSCVETYRIATWTIDKASPRVLRVTEDGRLAFTAAIVSLSGETVRLRQDLVRSKERRDLTLMAVEGESVCADLKK